MISAPLAASKSQQTPKKKSVTKLRSVKCLRCEAATSFPLRNVFSRFSFVLWLFLLNILDDEQHKKNKKKTEQKKHLLLLPGIQFWPTIFSVIFPYNFQYLSCQRQAAQILGKKPVQDSRKREGEREHIYMGCRVMDPLKCTTIAVKSKNVSAFVFIVVVVVGVKSCCGLSINNTLCQGVFFTVEKSGPEIA